MILSIIIPVYNVEKYLKKCIDSINLEVEDTEILLINDGATDSSRDICAEYEKKYENIKLIDKVNGGLSSARNEGIKHAKGKYLMFIDSDDYLIEDSIKNILPILKDSDKDVFLSDYYEVIDEDIQGEIKFNIKEKNNIREIQQEFFTSDECIWGVWKFIVRNEFLKENNIIFKHGYLHEDVDFTTRIMLNVKSFEYLPMKWYCYRIARVGSIMNSRKIKSTIHTAEIVVDLNQYMIDSKYPEDLYDLVISRLSSTFWGTIRYAVNSNDEDLQKLSDFIKKNTVLIKSSKRTKHKIFANLISIVGFRNVIAITKKVKARNN
ncbi:MAG: glycosyltransferase [Sarcina sp.]